MYIIQQNWHQIILDCFPKIKPSSEPFLTLELLGKASDTGPEGDFERRGVRLFSVMEEVYGRPG